MEMLQMTSERSERSARACGHSHHSLLGFSVLPKAEHRRECGYLCDGSGEMVEIG